MLDRLLIRELSLKDQDYFPAALELLNRTQGRNLFPEHYISRKLSDPLAYVVAAFIDEELIAVAVAEVLHDFKFYIPFDENIEEEFKDKVVGSFSTMCVHESYQGKGIGQKLSQKRLEWLKDRQCNVAIGISWISGKAHTSDRVFEKMGFGIVERVENFFYEFSLQSPFTCPACGSPPCTCAGVLYRLDFN